MFSKFHYRTFRFFSIILQPSYLNIYFIELFFHFRFTLFRYLY
eukprot:UN21369